MLEKVVKSNNRRASESLVEDQYEHISNNDFSPLAEVAEPAPTGRVTIVFTDVQNSTLLWDKAPEAMSIVSVCCWSTKRKCSLGPSESGTIRVHFAGAPEEVSWLRGQDGGSEFCFVLSCLVLRVAQQWLG